MIVSCHIGAAVWLVRTSICTGPGQNETSPHDILARVHNIIFTTFFGCSVTIYVLPPLSPSPSSAVSCVCGFIGIYVAFTKKVAGLTHCNKNIAHGASRALVRNHTFSNGNLLPLFLRDVVVEYIGTT